MSATDRFRRLLAERIAAELFTNGRNEEADRLVLTKDTTPPLNLGGWGRGPFIDRIEQLLRADDEAVPRRLRTPPPTFCPDCGKRVPCQVEYPRPPEHCPNCGSLQTERRFLPAIGPFLHCHSCHRDTASDRYAQP